MPPQPQKIKDLFFLKQIRKIYSEFYLTAAEGESSRSSAKIEHFS